MPLGHSVTDTVAGIGTPDCETALHAIYDKKAGKKAVTGYRTADLAKQLLQQIMDYAVRQGHRSDNPVRSVSRIQGFLVAFLFARRLQASR